MQTGSRAARRPLSRLWLPSYSSWPMRRPSRPGTGTARRAPRRGDRARGARGGPGVCVKAYSSVGNWLMTLDDATKVAYGVDAMLWIDLEGFAGFRRCAGGRAVERVRATRDPRRPGRWGGTFSYGDGWIALGRDPPETAATRGGYLFRLLGRATRSTGPARGSWAQFRALLRGELAPAYAKPSTVRDAVRDFRAAAGFHQVDRRTDDAHCRFNTFFARTATLRAELDRRRDALGQARRYAAVHVRSAFGENPVYVRGPLTQERLHAREPPLHLCLAYLRRAADATACLRSAPGVAPASVFVASNSPAVERACARLGAGVLAVSAADAHRSRHTDGAGAALEFHALVSFFLLVDAEVLVAGHSSFSSFSLMAAQISRKRADARVGAAEPSLAVDAWFAPGARPRGTCADGLYDHGAAATDGGGAPLAFPWGQPGAVAASDFSRRVGARQRAGGAAAAYELTDYGFGSDLHQWAHALLWADERNLTLVAVPRGAVSCADASGAARRPRPRGGGLPRPAAPVEPGLDLGRPRVLHAPRAPSRRSRATLAPWRTPASRGATTTTAATARGRCARRLPHRRRSRRCQWRLFPARATEFTAWMRPLPSCWKISSPRLSTARARRRA